jgi:hypothetical protein
MSIGLFLIKFYVQINASTVSEDNELLNKSNIYLLVLKADSEKTVEMGIANTSRVIAARIGYLDA